MSNAEGSSDVVRPAWYSGLLYLLGLSFFGLATSACGAGKAPKAVGFNRVSNLGTAVSKREISLYERRLLRKSGASSAHVRLVGNLDGVRFYVTLSTTNHQPCYATGRGGPPPRFGIIACPSSGRFSFPSSHAPIFDLSILRWRRAARYPYVLELSGFAADGVDAVGAVGTNGRTYWTRVVRNI
jgi:hypothetical protein